MAKKGSSTTKKKGKNGAGKSGRRESLNGDNDGGRPDMATSQGSAKTSYKYTSWYSDGGHLGAPSSMHVLLQWLTTPDNYRRWKHQSKRELANEILLAMSKSGIERRHTNHSVRCKIYNLERQYAAAKDWLVSSGQDEADDAVKGEMMRKCPHFHDLAPVFQPVLDAEKVPASDTSTDDEDPPHESQVARDVDDESRAPAQASAVNTSDGQQTAKSSSASMAGRFPNVMVQETLRCTITSLDGEPSSPFAKRLCIRRATRQRDVGGGDGDSSARMTTSGEQREQILLRHELEGKLAVVACESETKQVLTECRAECAYELMRVEKDVDVKKTQAAAALEMKRVEAAVALDVESTKTHVNIDVVVKTELARKQLVDGGVSLEEVNAVLPASAVDLPSGVIPGSS